MARKMKIEDVKAGTVLDQGVFVSYEQTTFRGEVNPHTWLVRLEDGTAYVESRGAKVRVH